MNALRPELPPLPERMASLPIDDRGYPVPWFVAWFDGKPDHRVIDTAKMKPALAGPLCWICGQHLGRHRTLTIGPMCSITRTIAEPPSHLECARFSAKACPFLSRPHAHRREAGLPFDPLAQAPGMIKRNPGVVVLWTTKTTRLFWATHSDGKRRPMFDFEGEPEHVEYWAEGRPATFAEVCESINSGLPLLADECKSDADRAELHRRHIAEIYRLRGHFEVAGA